MGRIYLLRHGQASLLGADYDRLSPLGERQARVLGEWLGPRVPRPLLAACGTLRRQGDTLRLLAQAAGWPDLPGRVDPNLDEYSHEAMLAQAFPELADPAALQARLQASAEPRREFQSLFERGLAAWLRGDIRLPGGLSWERFRERNVATLRGLAADCGSGACAVVVTSGGAIAAVCQHLLGVPQARVPLLHNAVHNASMTVLLTRGEELALSVFNSVAHLEQDPGGPSLVTYR